MHRKLVTTALFAALAVAARADDATLRLQDADISAHGSRLSILRLPVDVGRKTLYRDVTIDFRANASGDVFINSAVKPGGETGAPAPVSAPLVVSRPSPPPVVQAYRAGTYRSADGTAYHLANEGVPYFGKLPTWHLTILGPGGHALDDASWSDGPIDENPLHKRLRNAGITSQAFSWGTSQSGSGVGFDSGALIGATAVGSTLTVYSFHKGCCLDTQEATHVLSFDLISAD